MLPDVIRKLHTYAGLLTFVNLVIYGIVGFTAAFEPPPGETAARQVIYLPFTPPPNATDMEVAEQVRRLLHLDLARPVQPFVVQRDAAMNLVLDFRHANGRNRATLFESEGRLRVEVTRSAFSRYLSSLHVTSAVFRTGDWRMQLWAYYNEFAMWCLIGMALSGTALWLLTRPGHRAAQISLALGSGLFSALYFWTK
jgi:hypothetical protein